jgi:hypothetical protein
MPWYNTLCQLLKVTQLLKVNQLKLLLEPRLQYQQIRLSGSPNLQLRYTKPSD